jgi:hypothetical protein
MLVEGTKRKKTEKGLQMLTDKVGTVFNSCSWRKDVCGEITGN